MLQTGSVIGTGSCLPGGTAAANPAALPTDVASSLTQPLCDTISTTLPTPGGVTGRG